MTKKSFHPYMRPLVGGFAGKKFLDQSKVLLSFLKETSLRKVNWAEDKHWIFVVEPGAQKKRRRQQNNNWMPKLYVCVRSEDYWSVITELIFLSQRAPMNWKFCKNLDSLSRPDKIVIHGKNILEIKKIVRLIRPLLHGKKFHNLEYASTTVQSGLEKKGKGVFVGIDPQFLKKVSWRFYRWAIDEAIIKPNCKKGRLDNDIKKILNILNISLKHQGPKTFKPSKRNNSLIKELWKEVI